MRLRSSISLAPEQTGRLSPAAAQNYSPVYRLRGGDVQEQTDFEAEGLDVLFRKESAYHAIAVVQDSSRATSASTTRSRAR